MFQLSNIFPIHCSVSSARSSDTMAASAAKEAKCPKCWAEDLSDSDCTCNPYCVICAEHPSLPIKGIPFLIEGEEVQKI